MRSPTCITTYTGRAFNFQSPHPTQIEMADIAHGLSLVCRWAGQSVERFSVAQHSVAVSLLCPPHLARWGLLHDASEAYCGDVSRPFKLCLPDYQKIERAVMRAIAERFNLGWPEPPELKQYDNAIQCVEAQWLMHDNYSLIHDDGTPLQKVAPIPVPWQIREDALSFPWLPKTAERRFLDRCAALGIVP